MTEKNTTEVEVMPPHDLETEKAVIWHMIHRSQSLTQSRPIRPGIFYDERNAIIGEQVLELSQGLGPEEGIDLLILSHYLQEIDLLERAGGPGYLADVCSQDYYDSAVSLNQYLTILDELYMRRQHRRIGQRLIEASGNLHQDPQEIAQKTAELMTRGATPPDLQTDASARSNVTVALVQAAYAEAKELAQSGRKYAGIDTGFHQLSDRLNGLRKAELTILGARPSIGKTTLALQIACHAARHESVRVGILSLEMSQAQIGRRLIDLLGGLDPNRHGRGLLTPEEELLKGAAETELGTMDIRIYSGCQQIDALTSVLMANPEIDLWIVDHLHLIRGADRNSRHDEITGFCQILKDITITQDVPILCLAQLNRKLEERADKKPMVEHLRESGSIEECADNVLLLWRPGCYPELLRQDPQFKTLVEIYATKLRYGQPGTVFLDWENDRAIFLNEQIKRPQFI